MLRQWRKDVNIREQLVAYPEHLADSEFFRSDSRRNAAGATQVAPRQNLTNVPARSVNPAFSEDGECCTTHPFSGFAAFMD